MCPPLWRPFKELKGYARVHLEPGAEQRVVVRIPCERLAMIGSDLKPVVEPGDFDVLVGASSRDEDLQTLRFSVTA